jgi:hypothetical protein
MFSVKNFASTVLFAASVVCRADNIDVPNSSFEQPPVPEGAPAYPVHVAWQQTPKRADYVESGQFTWNVLTGVFPNSATGASDHIDNMDGNQAAYLFSERENGIFQVLPATYSVGYSYKVTVGLVGSANIPPTTGSTLMILLCMTNATGQLVSVGAGKTITYDTTTFPAGTDFREFTLNVHGLKANDPAVDQNIAVLIKSTTTDDKAGGVWDIDNVRLSSYREFSSVTVPNFSFENPTIPPGTPAYPVIDNWTQLPKPAAWDEAVFGPWGNLAGVFPNPAAGEAGHISNMDGNQAAYLFATPSNGIYQDLNTQYSLDAGYKLLVGLVASSSIPPNDLSPISVTFFYRDAQNNIVSITKQSARYDTLTPHFASFVDVLVSLPAVRPSDPWLGKNIGILIAPEPGASQQGGVWDVENVRLDAIYGAAIRVAREADNIRISWDSEIGVSYVVRSTENFFDTSEAAPMAGTGGELSVLMPISDSAHKFFTVGKIFLPDTQVGVF